MGWKRVGDSFEPLQLCRVISNRDNSALFKSNFHNDEKNEALLVLNPLSNIETD